MSSTKVRASSTLNKMNPEQENLDSLIRQAIEKEPFLSFSRVADRPIQLIHLLNAFEQQGNDKLSNSSRGDSFELKEYSDNIFNGVNSFSSELNGIKDSVHSKGCMSNAKGTKCTPQMQSRKFPEAVVSFAQAAAKATGEPEKYLPGWPFLSPSKTQLQTCDKCSREFYSFINYRRHRRVHRRSLNVDKDSTKNRDFLGTFWDKLSTDEAKELVSLKNVAVEFQEITGSSVIKALSTWFRRPGMLASLPQAYIKAGLTLLDLVQASPSAFPVSSQVLFSVLDEASEKTFLCAGTAPSLQKYIFDVEAVKKAMEIKNVVACASFLIEIELVKAWLVDKDAEALRCYKLLVDEEEAAQRRQVEILERKRLKKLRQKEQKVKEEFNEDKVNSPPDYNGSADTSSSRALSEDCTSERSQNQEQQLFDSAESSAAEDDGKAEKSRSHHKQTEDQNFGHCGKISELPFYSEEAEQEKIYRIQRVTGFMQSSHSRYANSRLNQNSPHSFQAGYSSASRPLINTRENNSRDSKIITRANGRKVWTIKSKPIDEDYGKYDTDVADGEVLIGSINVSLGAGELHHPTAMLEPQSEDMQIKPDSSLCSFSRMATKLWRPVSRHGDGINVQNDDCVVKRDVQATSSAERSLPHESCLSYGGAVSDLERCKGAMMFSGEVARAFLSQRWKEAIARDEVVVISSSEIEASGSPDATEGNLANSLPQTSNLHGRHILGRVENRMSGVGVSDTSNPTASWHSKFRPKSEKNSSLKYVPKQRTAGAGE